jgi:hypothetical protein
MIQRPFLFGFLLAGLFIITNLWHMFARWFVNSQGLVAGFLLLLVVLLICLLLDPYSD